MHIVSNFKYFEAEGEKKENRAQVSCDPWKLIQKPHTKVVAGGKTGVEMTMVEGDRRQEDNIIGENVVLLLYTRFIMSVGICL